MTATLNLWEASVLPAEVAEALPTIMTDALDAALGQAGTRDPYARVVAAELACEHLDDLRQEIGDARDQALVSARMV